MVACDKCNSWEHLICRGFEENPGEGYTHMCHSCSMTSKEQNELQVYMYIYVKLKVWIWTIHRLPAQSMDPYFERAIHGLSAQSMDRACSKYGLGQSMDCLLNPRIEHAQSTD